MSPLDQQKTVREVYGDMEEWVLELGPYRFLLFPSNSQWWFYDAPHGYWKYTGYHAGEAKFIVNGWDIELWVPESRRTKASAQANVLCPSCGTAASPGAAFCLSCGASLEPAKSTIAGPEAHPRFCTQCGARATEGAKFCSACGNVFSEPAPAKIEERTLFCTQCGAKLAAGVRFCTECGKPV